MEAQVRPGKQTHHSPLMRGRADHPGRGNGIAKTQRHKQHGAVLQHVLPERWLEASDNIAENEAVVLGCVPVCTLFCRPWGSRACESKWAEEWQENSCHIIRFLCIVEDGLQGEEAQRLFLFVCLFFKKKQEVIKIQTKVGAMVMESRGGSRWGEMFQERHQGDHTELSELPFLALAPTH